MNIIKESLPLVALILLFSILAILIFNLTTGIDVFTILKISMLNVIRAISGGIADALGGFFDITF